MESRLAGHEAKRETSDEVVNEVVKMFLENGYTIGQTATRRVNCYTDKDGYFGGCKVNVPLIDTRCVKMIVFEKKTSDGLVPVIVLVPQKERACKKK